MFRKQLKPQTDALETVHAAIMKGVPSDWLGIYVQIEAEDRSVSVARFVTTDASPKPAYVNVGEAQFDACEALRAASEPRWTNATLRYTRASKVDPIEFKADYGYEPVPMEDEYERRLTWEAKYLPK